MQSLCLLFVAIHASAGVIAAGVPVGISIISRSQPRSASTPIGVGAAVRHILVVIHGAGVVILPWTQLAFLHRACKCVFWNSDLGSTQQRKSGNKTNGDWGKFHHGKKLISCRFISLLTQDEPLVQRIDAPWIELEAVLLPLPV